VKGKVLPSEERTGTGFLIDSRGHLLTNYHVVEGTTDVSVIFQNDRIVRAHVVATDPSNDLALLEAPATDGIRPLRLGDSTALVPGQPIAAIGNPLGLTDTLTSGIVSALNRTIAAPNGYSIAHIIQGDIEIDQGSSGGPLFDAYGDVVGITAAIARQGTGSVPGIAYAIPAATIRTVLARLLKGMPVEHGFLGVNTLSIVPRYAFALGLQKREGALVLVVHKGTPAAKAGLRACTKTIKIDGGSYRTGGDIITAVNGQPVRTSDDLSALIGGMQPGQVVRLRIYRGRRSTLTIRVRLGQRPAS
jgi:2-alkenal reductase